MPATPATTNIRADVVLPRIIERGTSATFHYAVPDHLREQVSAGQLVWVPLKQQLVQGIVLALHPHPPAPARPLRPIADCADPAAIIPPAGLQLAQWLSETYLSPLFDALLLFLPPGVRQKSAATWRATPQGIGANLGTLPEDERAILYYLQTHGETSDTDLQRELRSSAEKRRQLCGLLEGRGLIERATRIQPPAVRPRTERIARLCVGATNDDTLHERLHRAPKQQAVVQWLREHAGNGLPVTTRELSSATGADLALLRALEKKGLLLLETREVRRDPLAAIAHLSATVEQEEGAPPLTAGQRFVWEPIARALDALPTHREDTGDTDPPVFLMHGVTGSGKTEVYLRAVARALRLGRQALVLVPEIALSTQLVRRFSARFPGQVAVLHSQLSPGERYDEWRRVRRGEAGVVIGSRSAIFAPLTAPGVLIVDEEHEPGYKSDQTPRYHARDVAVHLGKLTGCVVLLGSATPAVESYTAAQKGRYTLLTLPERVGRTVGADGLPHTSTLPLPHVRLVDMRHELAEENRSIFSRPLQDALASALAHEEQVILFLNRRGAASFVMCRDCGTVITCPSCDSPLVQHYQPADDTTPAQQQRGSETPPPSVLMCHSCNHRTPLPSCCPHCLSTRIKSFGVGTQRVEQEVLRLFPHARPLRWDRDSTTGKHAHSRLLDQFLRHEADVLVGTQMIAKGLDLPRVAVVGVVAADTALYIPDFRSGERTFQLLTQVAGRAGRRTAGAKVIIQTYTPEHYALRAAQEHDYHAFYNQEISFRRQTAYPPAGRLVRCVYTAARQDTCRRAAETLAANLRAAIARHHLRGWGIIGPAPAFFQRQRGRWRWHLLLRLPADAPTETLAMLLHTTDGVQGWSIDVDPMHVL